MNKIVAWVVTGGAVLVLAVFIGGYLLTREPAVVATNTPPAQPLETGPTNTVALAPSAPSTPVAPSFNLTQGSTSVAAANSTQSSEPVLVKTLTVNARAAKTLEESNDRTGTYLGESLLLSSGDLAYTIKHNLGTSLFLDEAKIADNVFILQEMAGKLMYISNDIKSSAHSLFSGTEMLATAPVTTFTDIFDVKEIDGKLAYTVYNKVLKQKTLFYDGKQIATGQDIKNIQKTSKGISYITHDFSADTDTLFYNGKAVTSAFEIPDYVEESNGKLAYTTFTYVGKAPPKDGGGFMGGEYPTVETLFEDGKKIITADLINLKNISGKLAYTTSNAGKYQLFYDGKIVQSADNIDKLTDVAGEPVYLATDYGAKELRLFQGDRLITKTKMDGSIQFSEIGGKLEYSLYDSTTRESQIFYDEKKLTGNIYPYSLKSINGKLVYVIIDQSQNGSLYYGNQKISGEHDVKNFVVTKSDPKALYFPTSKETGSSTVISIYKVSFQ